MATEETPRFKIPYPSTDDQGTWFTKFKNGMTQVDSNLFALLENLKIIMKQLPMVTIVGPVAGQYWFTPSDEAIFVSRTLFVDLIVTPRPLELLPGRVVGLTLTSGAVGPQYPLWELFENGMDIDVAEQALGYVNVDYSITWFNGNRLSVGVPTILFAPTAGAGPPGFMAGAGNPNGVVPALAGTSYHDVAAGIIYMNVDSGTTWLVT